MSTLDRRTFLKSALASLLGAVLGRGTKAIAAEAALPAEEPQEEMYAYRGGLARDTDWLALPGTTKIYLSPTEDGDGWVSYDSGLNWSRCDDIGIYEPDGEWMDVAEYMANYPVAELAYCSNEVQGVRWDQSYYADPLDELLRGLQHYGVAVRHTFERQLGIEGDKE